MLSASLLTLLITVLAAFTVLPALMMALSTERIVLTGVDCVHEKAMVFVFVVILTAC